MKALFLTQLPPLAEGADCSYCGYSLFKTVCHSCETTLLSLYDPLTGLPPESLQKMAASCRFIPHPVYLRRRPFLYALELANCQLFNHSYAIHKFKNLSMSLVVQAELKKHHYDVIHLNGLMVAQFIPWDKPHPPVLLLEHNVESALMELGAKFTKNPLKQIFGRREAKCLGTFEKQTIQQCAETWALSPKDQLNLRKLSNSDKVVHIHCSVDSDYWNPENYPYQDNNTLIFCAKYSWLPNLDGINWFLNEVWPRILKKSPQTKLLLIGPDLPKDLQAKCDGKQVIATGFVKDLRQALSQGITIIPLRYGSGIKQKTLMAMSMGLPIVSTSIGMDGTMTTNGQNCFIADEAEQFAQAVLTLQNSPALRQKFGTACRQIIRTYFTNAAMNKTLASCYERVIR